MHLNEVGYDKVGAGGDKHFGQIRRVSRLTVAPRAAVNEDVYGRVWQRSFVDVELFIFGGSVGNALRRDPFEHRLTGKPASGGDELLVGCINTLIVGVVELLLIHIEPDKRTFEPIC